MHRDCIIAALLVGSSVLVTASNAADTGELPYRVGAAAVDITPDYPVRLNGFGFRRAESEGVRQQIWAKALAIEPKGQPPVLVVALDTLGVTKWLRYDLLKHLDGKLSPERIALTATHTHTAPMIRDLAPTIFSTPIPPEHQAHIDRYSDELKAKVRSAADQALANLKPAKLAWAVGSANFAINRRTAGGPVDHDLPMLVATGPDDKVIAVWANYACHCVTLAENQIGGDWAGYAQQHIEREFPDAVALISIGCGADSNPSARDKPEIAEGQGLEIAREVKRLIRSSSAPMTGGVSAKLETIKLPLAPLPSHSEWEQRAGESTPTGFHAKTMLERLDRGEKLASEIEYAIQTWTFGDSLALVFLPGEVVVDYSVQLKGKLDRSRLWINAYANDSPGYIPSERILREGGYEGGGAMVYYAIPGPYATGVEEKIVTAVDQQLEGSFKAKAASK